MSETMLQGVTLTVLGMGLVFAALGFLVLVMLGLQRVSVWTTPRAAPPEPGPAAGGEADELARVAGIAVALVKARGGPHKSPALGRLLEESWPARSVWLWSGRWENLHADEDGAR